MSNQSEALNQTDDYPEIPAQKFQQIGKSKDRLEVISRPSLTYFQDGWRRLKKNRVAFASMLLVLLYILLALIGPGLNGHDHTGTNSGKMYFFFDSKELESFSFGEKIMALLSSGYWFGADSLGRDLWSRIWMGARVSLAIGFTATFINTVIGGLVGGISGYYGGKADLVIMRFVDILYGIPYLIVAILIMLVLGSGVLPLIIALIMVGWIGTARFVRGQVLKIKQQEFIAAARVLGVSNIVIIYRHIIPNLLGLMITNLMMAVPAAIFSEAFLSYIGLGIKPPESSWGVLARMGVMSLRSHPHLLFFPAFFICTTMLALNLLGDGMRDALDPKLRGTE